MAVRGVAKALRLNGACILLRTALENILKEESKGIDGRGRGPEFCTGCESCGSANALLGALGPVDEAWTLTKEPYTYVLSLDGLRPHCFTLFIADITLETIIHSLVSFR